MDDRVLDAYPGEQLRALRTSLGISQRHLAEEARVDQAEICRLERGADARWSTWKRLFAALGYAAVLEPEDSDDTEDYYQDGIQMRKDKMEEGRSARWG